MPSQPPEDDFSGPLKMLNKMGFTDNSLNRRALTQAGGRIYAAIDLIVAGQVKSDTLSRSGGGGNGQGRAYTVQQQQRVPTSAPSKSTSTSTSTSTTTMRYKFPTLSPDNQRKLLQLNAMGFTDEGKCRHALEKCQWNVEEAVVVLVDKERELDSGFSAVDSVKVSNGGGVGNGSGVGVSGTVGRGGMTGASASASASPST